MKALKFVLGLVVLAVLVVLALDAIPYKNAEAVESCNLYMSGSDTMRMELQGYRMEASGLDDMAKLSAMANDLSQAGICNF